MIRIRPARKRDLPRVVALSDITFGQGYLTTKTIPESDETYVLYVNDSLVGFASVSMWEPYDQTDGDLSLGYIESVGVHPDHQRMGYGRVLVGVCVADLILRGATVLECTAAVWSNQDRKRPPLASPLEKNGFVFEKVLEGYWKDEPPVEGYSCIACGKGQCRCDAWLYKRGVNTSAN